jgi:predicted small lipoprotein YifL
MRLALLLAISAFVLALTACGQTGALYLPEPPEAAAAEAEPDMSEGAGIPDLEEDSEDDNEEDDAPEP